MVDATDSNSMAPDAQAQQAYEKAFDPSGAAEANFGGVQSLLNAQSPTPLGTPTNPPVDFALRNAGAVEPNQLADATAAQANGGPLSPADVQANQYPATNYDSAGMAQQIQAPAQAAQVTSVADKLQSNVPTAPQVPVDPMQGKVEAAYGAQMSANNAVAKAVEAKAVADQAQFANAEKAYVEAEQKRQETKVKFDSDYNGKMANYEASVADYKQAAGDKIIPGKLIANMDTAQKLQTGLFMALSSYGSALSGQENQAMKVINNAINQDIDAQRFNIENKLKGARMGVEANQYMLVQMKDKFHDDESATLASRAAMLQMTQQQLNVNASKLDQSTAGPKAQALNSQLELQKQQVLAQLKQQQAQQFMLNSVSGNDAKHLNDAQLTALESVNKGSRERYVNGYGFAANGKQAEKFTEYAKEVVPALDALDRIKALTADYNRVSDRTKRAQIETEMAAVVGNLRLPLTGPGILTQQERDMISEQVIGNPNSMFALPKLQRAKMNTIYNKLQNDLKKTGTISGLPEDSFKKSVNSNLFLD